MENVTKALEIAAGVMLGVMLMALVAFFFTKISSWPQNEDDITDREQLAKFNKEYEVYEKSKMYGVDVLSCLNKVVSNNEKYAQGGAFLGGNAGLSDYRQRENYWINVKIKLGTGSSTETKLKETVMIYYCNEDNKEVEKFLSTSDDLYVNSKGLEKLYSAIEKVGNYTKLTGETSLSKNIDQTVDVFTNKNWIKDGYINLIVKEADGQASDMNPDLQTLLHTIQTLSNNQSTSNLTFVVRNTTKQNYRKWTQVVWQTVLYDLKNRKFKCTGLNYNNTTGRVNEIIFEEI